MNGSHRRTTRRERKLPKLRGFSRGTQGNKAMPRDIPPQCRTVMASGGNILCLHRRIAIDNFRRLKIALMKQVIEEHANAQRP